MRSYGYPGVCWAGAVEQCDHTVPPKIESQWYFCAKCSCGSSLPAILKPDLSCLENQPPHPFTSAYSICVSGKVFCRGYSRVALYSQYSERKAERGLLVNVSRDKAVVRRA
jgi:hypothetical protein